jgi:hypothetical protein
MNYLPFTVWLGYDGDTANLREIGQGIVDLSITSTPILLPSTPYWATRMAQPRPFASTSTSPSTDKLLQASVEAVSVSDINNQ